MSVEEEFIVEEEWVEEDFIDGESYEEQVMEDDVEDHEMKPTIPLQRSSSSADFSFDGSTIVEFDLGSYNGESSSGEGEPDNYEEACRELIKLIYPQGGSHDADDMIRRCDLRNLYSNLRQQHKFLIHSKKALAESDRKLERWESFDDSNGAFSAEAGDRAIISFDEPLNEGETQQKFGINDEQNWPEMEDFPNPWESKERNGMSNENLVETDALIGSAAVEETQDQVMMEPQSESSKVQLIPWLERNAGDPDDYEAACRALIPLVYKDEDESDPNKMLRRSDPKDLYRHLKHQHWYLIHSGAISQNPVSKGSTHVQTSSDNKGPSLDDIWAVREGGNIVQGERQTKSQDTAIGENTETSRDVDTMDADPPVQAMDEFQMSEEQHGAINGTNKILGEGLDDTAAARINTQEDWMNNTEETTDENEVEIIKWLDRYADDPDDYEEASRKLVSVLYSEDDEYDVETTLSRSSPKDLFRYLKRQYWYRVHMGTLPENAMENTLYTSNTTSGEAPALSESSKLIATVKNRISLIESTNIGEKHRYQQSSAASSTASSSAGNAVVATQMAIEPQIAQSPSGLNQATDKPVASGNFMQQPSSLTVDDNMVGFDDMDSSEASSSLEPPPGYHSQASINDQKERKERPESAERDGIQDTHNSQNLEVSLRSDASSVYSHENINSSNDIKMDSTLRHAILDQMNEDEVPKLNEQNQDGGETSKTDVTAGNDVVQPVIRGPTESEDLSKHTNDGTLETGSGFENFTEELSSDHSRFVNTGLQRSKRSNFTDSANLNSSKRAKTEVGAPSDGNQLSGNPKHDNRDNRGQTRSLHEPLNHHHDNDFTKLISEAEKDLNDTFESEAIEALQVASLQIENSKKTEDGFIRPFVFSTALAKGIIDDSIIRSASKHYRDGEDFPPHYTSALKRAATMMLDGDIDFSKIGNVAVNVETMGEEEKRMWDNASFSSNGGEENAERQVSENHDLGTRTGRMTVDIDDTNADLQVGEVQGDKASGEETDITETEITGRSAADRDVSSSFLSSPANALRQEDVGQVERTNTSSTLDRADMAKRQHSIEEELFSIVSDAEKLLGGPISEEMLAALILAATKTAHRKRYYDFIKDTIVFLPSVAKAVLENDLLEVAARHFGNEISSQYITVLKAASDTAVDRNLDYKYMDSHAVTLNITFPEKAKHVSKISQSKLGSGEYIAGLEPSRVEKNITSVTDAYNGANEHVSNSLNEVGPVDLIELEEEAKLRLTKYRDTKENLLKEYAEIDHARNVERGRIARELDSLADSRGLEQSRGGREETSQKKALLAKQLKNLRDNLASAKERLEQERHRSDSGASDGDKNMGLFGMFGVRRRTMDLEKEKEQQAKLMQQKIREMELEHSLAQIEREIATVQQKYDELRDQKSAKVVDIADSSQCRNGHLDTKRASLLQDSRKLEETFLATRNTLDERLKALENSRRDDEVWYQREKAAVVAWSETSNNGHCGESSKSDPNVRLLSGAVITPVEGAHDEKSEGVAANQQLRIISQATSKQERSKRLSVEASEASQLSGGPAKEQTERTGAHQGGERVAMIGDENDGISEVETTQDPASIVPDHLVGANQPVTVHSSDMDSLAATELFDPPSQPLPAKPLLHAARKAQEGIMQKSRQSSLSAEEQAKEEEDTACPLGDVSRRLPDHLVGLNQPRSRSSDLESLAPSDLFESSAPSRPDKPLLAAAMKAKETLAEQRGSESLSIQLGETDPVMRTTGNAQRGTRKKLLMLFSSTTVDRSQQTNQHRAVVVLKAHDINYESMDGSDATSVAKRNELFRLSNLRGTYPQFFVVEGASISFVGTFESIQDLNDRGLLKSLVDDREEHYRQEFMELLERDDKGESVDEDRLYNLQLYARRRVGEELSTSERFDLEEFEREEAKLENAETSYDSTLQRDEVSPDRARKERADLQKSSSLGSGSRSEAFNEGESSSAKAEDRTNLPPVLRHNQLEQGSPSMQVHPGVPKSSTSSRNSSADRLLSWRTNGKRMVAEKLQASVSKASARDVEDKSEETLESREILKETDKFALSKAATPGKTESIINEKKSRKEILAAKRKQIVESRRAKWGLKGDKSADSKEKSKPKDATSLGDMTSRLGPSSDHEKMKQRMAESKRLAEKTAKAREARLAREAELHKYTEQVKQKGRILNAKLEKQSFAEADETSSSPNIQKGTQVSGNGGTHKEPSEGSLLPHMVMEVERLSSFISRYEKKLETTCKSILSVAQKTGKTADLKRVMNLGLPDMYNYVTDQSWFKELASDSFSRPLSVSKRGKEDIIESHLVAFDNPDDYVAVGSARPGDSARLKMYTLSNLGKQFIKIDGPGVGDTGRFLSSLASSEGLSKQQIMERWSDISRLSGDSQSDRICKNIEDIMSFCSSAGFIE
mmetsp:Transcript_39432/g.95413  ORF Transcript_39432/g.95413 Transcript_39432/m.95413 type:complete len:2402 (+) Transcript_39432:184-7389(+)